MDAANILSSSVPAQTTVSGSVTTASEVTITNAPVQQSSKTNMVSVSQGQVQTDLSQTSQDAAGPTFQLKIMIEQNIVQVLSQLDKLFAKPQTLADFLPELIRQDMQNILSNQLFAATPETFEQGLTAMVKTNKDTADAFLQLAKGLNAALIFQDKLPDSVQKFLQIARPLLTELLSQIQSEINLPTAQEVQSGNEGELAPSLTPQTNVAVVPAQSTKTPQQGMTTSETVGTSLSQSSPSGTTNGSVALAEPVIVMQQGGAETDAAAPPAQSTAANGLNEVADSISEGEGSAGNRLLSLVTNETPGDVVQQQVTAPLTEQEQAVSVANNQPINDKQLLIKPLPLQNDERTTEPTVDKPDFNLVNQPTAQAVISNVLMMMNNPTVPAGPVGVDDFFNWIAQQFRMNQDNPGLQENLQQKVDVWSNSLSQLSEPDSKAFNEIKQQLEQQLPSQLKQIATQFPALKDLYVYNKMSDLAKYADLSQEQLSAAKESISRLAESFQKSLVDTLSFHSETGSSGKVLTFFMPVVFDGSTMYPAHIHIYHQNQPEKRGGPPVSETWLRIFLKTDYSGTVTLLFHVRQQEVDMKLGFSEKQAAQDFYAWLPDIRQSLANSPFTLQSIQVMSA